FSAVLPVFSYFLAVWLRTGYAPFLGPPIDDMFALPLYIFLTVICCLVSGSLYAAGRLHMQKITQWRLGNARCTSCGYCIGGANHPSCPECGLPLQTQSRAPD